MSYSRENEIGRYREAYKSPRYGMGDKRKRKAAEVLAALEPGSLLDVGAGRGEGVMLARAAGHDPVVGIEPVEYLAGKNNIMVGVATDLPFATHSWDTVMCLDVLEHLVPEDVEPALLEFRRVAKKTVFLTASERPHRFKNLGDLHISKRPIAEWQELFEKVFTFAEIKPLGMVGVSPGWLIRV